MNALRTASAVAVLAASTLVAGCGEQAKFRETRTNVLPHIPGSAVRVTSENGYIRVERAASDESKAPGSARIEADFRATTMERLRKVQIVSERDASGALAVRVEWPEGRREPSEGCSFRILVPNARGIRATTSNGDVHVADFDGEAVLTTSNGSISAIGHRGTVTARTSNAVVKMAGLTGRVDAETSNAQIFVRLAAENPGPVRLRTSNGGIQLTLGEAFHGSLAAETSNGTVDLSAVDTKNGTRPNTVSGTHASVGIGDGGEASTLHTSNGSIRVETAK